MSEYICYFEFRGKTYTIEDPHNRGIHSFITGFWVDKDLNWCTVSNSKWWIPPGKIITIEKVKP